MTWKIWRERAILWNHDQVRTHSPHEIHNKRLQAVNSARSRVASVGANKDLQEGDPAKDRPTNVEDVPRCGGYHFGIAFS